ncbi:hypothetical protein ACIA48_23870 [Mycobacterium sp. NPDC051804]|uniref:hypothetical protein n=1 Tax=Mycobacterium sp. NPDC051804 TaxID=3364295 RepID=UPI00379E1EC5
MRTPVIVAAAVAGLVGVAAVVIATTGFAAEDRPLRPITVHAPQDPAPEPVLRVPEATIAPVAPVAPMPPQRPPRPPSASTVAPPPPPATADVPAPPPPVGPGDDDGDDDDGDDDDDDDG